MLTWLKDAQSLWIVDFLALSSWLTGYVAYEGTLVAFAAAAWRAATGIVLAAAK
jgi:hypothetical protein